MRFKQLREENGYSLRDLEKLIDINKSTISRIETGNIKINVEHLGKYADFFNVTPSYILGESEIRNEQEFTNTVKSILIEHGFANRPIKDVKTILEKTIELYNSLKGED